MHDRHTPVGEDAHVRLVDGARHVPGDAARGAQRVRVVLRRPQHGVVGHKVGARHRPSVLGHLHRLAVGRAAAAQQAPFPGAGVADRPAHPLEQPMLGVSLRNMGSFW